MLWLAVAALAADPVLVVAKVGTPLYAHERDTTPVFATVSQVPLRVLSTHGLWLEVSTHLGVSAACRRLQDANTAVDLRLWIREEALARVVTRRVDVTAADGSRLVFHAGYQTPDTSRWAHSEAWSSLAATWEAVIPADAWGDRLTPDADKALPSDWVPVADVDAWDRAVSVAGTQTTPPDAAGLTSWGAHPVFTPALTPVAGGRLYASLGQGCLEVSAVAPGVHPSVPGTGLAIRTDPDLERAFAAGAQPGGLIGASGGQLGGLIGTRGAALPPANTPPKPLLWPDGTAAGDAFRAPPWASPRQAGPLTCGVVHLSHRDGVHTGPEVCAAADDAAAPAGAADAPVVPPTVQPSDPVILGALDRALIDATVHQKLSQLRYCYQRELVDAPTLQGRLIIKFTIASTGAVSQAEVKTTTLHHDAVEQCVLGRFLKMTFPPPNGGGIVVVSYPLEFAPH